MVKLTFHGAAETVTGSKYLLEAGGARVLFDCGLFQGLKELRLKNWQPLAFEPSSVDSVVLTHAHIDHIGFLPRFSRLGFARAAYATAATADLAEIILLDAAKNQEDDAEYANQKGFSKHKPALPLYDERDVRRALKLLRPIARNEWFNPAGPIWCRYHDAGHLLGSTMIEVEVRPTADQPSAGARPLRLLFSGDVGRYAAPLYHDPSPPPACDYLVCESTYGNRDHPPGSVLDQLAGVIRAAVDRGGVMLFASFAVGRAQQLMYLVQVLIQRGRIGRMPIYLDSPMSVRATAVYLTHAADHDLSELDLSAAASHMLDTPNVHLARTVEESKRINGVEGPAVIISSSGMMTGGRILHHLKRRLPEERNTIVVGGFMAAGTRGRMLQEGAARLRVHGRDVPVRSAVAEMSGLSGHAGRSELLRWLEPLPPPRKVFLTHGEKEGALALAEQLRTGHGWNVCVPKLGESFELEQPQ
ncbi:MAG: MBL fold metallo-hydrolase [Pirellulales bacterium]